MASVLQICKGHIDMNSMHRCSIKFLEDFKSFVFKGIFGLLQVGEKGVSGKWRGKCQEKVENWDCASKFSGV